MPKIEKAKNKKNLLQKETNKLLSQTSSNKENIEASLRQQIEELQKKLNQLAPTENSTLSELNLPQPAAPADNSTLNELDTTQFAPTETSTLNEENLKSTDSEPDESPSNQLYGQHYDKEDMVLIKNNIYCRRSSYESAIGSASKASHLIRRLLEGVFQAEAILECTLSGQAPKAQGAERRKKTYKCLNVEARKAILDFATEYAEKKGWKPIQTTLELNRTMTQKIGEIKRHYQKNI